MSGLVRVISTVIAVNRVTVCTVVSIVSQVAGEGVRSGGQSQKCVRSRSNGWGYAFNYHGTHCKHYEILRISLFELSNFKISEHVIVRIPGMHFSCLILMENHNPARDVFVTMGKDSGSSPTGNSRIF